MYILGLFSILASMPVIPVNQSKLIACMAHHCDVAGTGAAERIAADDAPPVHSHAVRPGRVGPARCSGMQAMQVHTGSLSLLQ